MKPLESQINSLAELREWLKREYLPRIGEREILLLEGPLGVGKTQVVQFLLEEWGCGESSSPSFAIHHRYETALGPFSYVDHLDLYRLEDDEDLESTGFWDLFSQSQGLIVIEWADRLDVQALPFYWPCSRLKLSFGGIEEEGNTSRRLVYERVNDPKT